MNDRENFEPGLTGMSSTDPVRPERRTPDFYIAEAEKHMLEADAAIKAGRLDVAQLRILASLGNATIAAARMQAGLVGATANLRELITDCGDCGGSTIDHEPTCPTVMCPVCRHPGHNGACSDPCPCINPTKGTTP